MLTRGDLVAGVLFTRSTPRVTASLPGAHLSTVFRALRHSAGAMGHSAQAGPHPDRLLHGTRTRTRTGPGPDQRAGPVGPTRLPDVASPQGVELECAVVDEVGEGGGEEHPPHPAHLVRGAPAPLQDARPPGDEGPRVDRDRALGRVRLVAPELPG